AAPYLFIVDEQHYREALELIESLLEEAEDTPDDPLNQVIELLAIAIERYENKDKELVEFDKRAMSQTPDIATLRLLMEQHHLSMSDLPEIGSKSMVSRVLSGERSLNKKHIKALCQRFEVSPNLFF
ncbi:helix-turn-helix domain-containing protein, partial [Alteromonas facilis]|uniref:helix-turn-helix domain-containing protein n=1 Tax=Alteromonas facilis TaxID=2048004 RepID=UPI000C281998